MGYVSGPGATSQDLVSYVTSVSSPPKGKYCRGTEQFKEGKSAEWTRLSCHKFMDKGQEPNGLDS